MLSFQDNLNSILYFFVCLCFSSSWLEAGVFFTAGGSPHPGFFLRKCTSGILNPGRGVGHFRPLPGVWVLGVVSAITPPPKNSHFQSKIGWVDRHRRPKPTPPPGGGCAWFEWAPHSTKHHGLVKRTGSLLADQMFPMHALCSCQHVSQPEHSAKPQSGCISFQNNFCQQATSIEGRIVEAKRVSVVEAPSCPSPRHQALGPWHP